MKKSRLAVFAAVCLATVLCLGGCGRDTPSEKPEDGLARSVAASVQVLADGFRGSGVIYERTEGGMILVTAVHVIPAGCREIRVVFADGTEAACADYRSAENADCAFLTVEEQELPPDWRERYEVVTKDRAKFDGMQSGDGVFLADDQAENALGCRFAMLVESWIYVEDFGSHMMLLSGEAHGGMSGGGIFAEDGCFLGILCGGNEKGELAALPYSVIETAFLQLPK